MKTVILLIRLLIQDARSAEDTDVSVECLSKGKEYTLYCFERITNKMSGSYLETELVLPHDCHTYYFKTSPGGKKSPSVVIKVFKLDSSTTIP